MVEASKTHPPWCNVHMALEKGVFFFFFQNSSFATHMPSAWSCCGITKSDVVSLPLLPLKSGVTFPSSWVCWFWLIEWSRSKLHNFQAQVLGGLQAATFSPLGCFLSESSFHAVKNIAIQRTSEAFWFTALTSFPESVSPTWQLHYWGYLGALGCLGAPVIITGSTAELFLLSPAQTTELWTN